MKVVQLTMDPELISRVDDVAKRLSTTRAAFARAALRAALERYEEAELEARHRAGYQRLPPEPDEFAIPEQDRAWGDDRGIDTW